MWPFAIKKKSFIRAEKQKVLVWLLVLKPKTMAKIMVSLYPYQRNRRRTVRYRCSPPDSGIRTATCCFWPAAPWAFRVRLRCRTGIPDEKKNKTNINDKTSLSFFPEFSAHFVIRYQRFDQSSAKTTTQTFLFTIYK